jgi:hypothetical protein
MKAPCRGADTADPGARPDVPERLAVAPGRMLAKDPEGRFACPADVVAVLQPFSAGAALARLSSAKDHQAEPQRPVKSSGGERGVPDLNSRAGAREAIPHGAHRLAARTRSAGSVAAPVAITEGMLRGRKCCR